MSDYNKKPIVLTEGKVFIDGEEIFDCVKCEIKFTPETYTGKVLGERSPSTRWKGFTITGTITETVYSIFKGNSTEIPKGRSGAGVYYSRRNGR